MSGVRWTPEQAAAILATEDTLLSANAGSGKTTTVIAKVLWLLGLDTGGVREDTGEPLPPCPDPCELREIAAARQVKGLTGVRLAELLGEPVYELTYKTADGTTETVIADARTGKLLEKIGEKKAIEIANAGLDGPRGIADIRLLTAKDVGGHHEYREKPLPAWAITYEEPSGLVAYVSQDTGRIESVRSNSWRVFDFFWLFHTLDFYGRDDINNYVLRAFSLLGLVTIFSGYVLFAITSPWFARKRKTRRND